MKLFTSFIRKKASTNTKIFFSIGDTNTSIADFIKIINNLDMEKFTIDAIRLFMQK